MGSRLKTGETGEEAARLFCIEHEYTIRERNYRKPYGEVDIVAEKDGILHFIEVKASKYYPETAFAPEIRVNARKIRKLKQICETYLREMRVSQDRHWQIDVISVILNQDNTLKSIELFENAVFELRY